jgi:predicted enzyme related to lactoylglutathione lyase
LRIISLERVLIAVTDFDRSCDNWRNAGFSLEAGADPKDGIRSARFTAGAVTVELCASAGDIDRRNPMAVQMAEAAARGGGIFGWLWGVADSDGELFAERSRAHELLDGVFTGAVAKSREAVPRIAPNANTVAYLEHMVVMVPQLDEAIVAFERVGVPCKRIREAGRGMRQAFFKLEESVFELVGPSGSEPRCWGLAFMCDDAAAAVAGARRNGLQATEPKPAIQGGRIARIVAPLDAVAVAFMDKR